MMEKVEPGSVSSASLIQRIRGLVRYFAQDLYRRSQSISRFFDARMDTVALAWLTIFLPVATLKIVFAATPAHSLGELLELAVPYFLIAIAPIAGFAIAHGSFPRHLLHGQPSFSFAMFGKWRSLGPIGARDNVAFGPVGFMASLMIGMVLNVVIRSFEFMLAVPAMNSHAPEWGQELFWLMAFDNMSMNFFYMVAFVMALRSVPLFPRMLLFVWCLDIAFQLLIARHMAATPDLPWSVAEPLRNLLEGNINKVLISAFVWLPYLLLSERVNVTYRHRAAR